MKMVGQGRNKTEAKDTGASPNIKVDKKDAGNHKQEEKKNMGQNNRDGAHHGGGAHRRGGGHGGDRGGRGFRQRRGGGGGFRGDRNQQRNQDESNLHGDEGDDGNMETAPSVPLSDKKFTGRCRLFVGNLTAETSEDEFKELFKEFGEFSEVFINPARGFGFIKMDTRQNAEKARVALDGLQHKGRVLRVRFAAHGSALKVKYLPTHVSNEMLEQSFQQFGDLERAVVIVDDRGRSIGEGIVEFARKPGANQALNRINNGVFIMGTTPRPIVVEPLEQRDEDGLPEKFVQKNGDVIKERENPPRFAAPGSFEYDFGLKWKEVYQLEGRQQEQMKLQLEEACTKLEMDMETAQHEHQTMLLRQDLMRRQEELRRLEEQHAQELNRRMEMRRQEVERRQDSNDMRRQELLMRQQQEDEMRRRQMDHGMSRNEERFSQERMMGREMNRGDMGREMGRERGNAPPLQPPPAPPAALGLDRPRGGQSGMGPGPGMVPQGLGAGSNEGMGQGNMGMNSSQMRQSRFDQPPQGNDGAMMGGPGGNMGGPGMGNSGNMGGPGGQGPPGGMGRGPGGPGHMANDRMMDRRDHRDEFFDTKRPRRF